MADYVVMKKSTLTGIGDAIRGAGIAQSGQLLSPAEMKQELEGIPKRSAADLTASGATVSVPQGYYPEAVSKSVTTTGLGTPVISVDANGKITAKVTHTLSGWVEADSKTGTKQLTTQAGKTVTPTTQEQTAVKAGTYVTGDIKVAAAAAGGEKIDAVYKNGNVLLVQTQNTVTQIDRLILLFRGSTYAVQIYGDGNSVQMFYIQKSDFTWEYSFTPTVSGRAIQIDLGGLGSGMVVPSELVSGVILYK